MKALERLKRFLSGKTNMEKQEVEAEYLDTEIKSISVKKENERYVKLEFFLENDRVFLKKFDKLSSKYLKEWANKKIGDEVTLLIYPDGIIRDIF